MLFRVTRKKDGLELGVYAINQDRFLVYADDRWKWLDMQAVEPAEAEEKRDNSCFSGGLMMGKARMVEELKSMIVGDDPGTIMGLGNSPAD